MASNEDIFRANAVYYNEALKASCASTAGVYYERLHGFTGMDVCRPKPVEVWSDDKIHLRTEAAAPGTAGATDRTPMDQYRTRLFYAIKHYLSDQ